jgi:AraC-like DNA-binding protein
MGPVAHWRGSLVLGSGIAVYAGAGSSAAAHRHSAIQVIVARDAPLRLSIAGTDLEAHAAVVPADVDHSFSARGGELLLILVEPSGVLGTALDAFAVDHLAADISDALATWTAPPPGPEEVVVWARAALAEMIGTIDSSVDRSFRPEVADAARLVAEQLTSVPRLDQIAREVGLSPRQLSRSFTLQVGMPFRRFIVWSRIRRAVLTVRDGHDLTTAAATAGFADSAHFSRVFLAMFGLQPSRVLPFVSVVEADIERGRVG